jgi:hypothetical protein
LRCIPSALPGGRQRAPGLPLLQSAEQKRYVDDEQYTRCRGQKLVEPLTPDHGSHDRNRAKREFECAVSSGPPARAGRGAVARLDGADARKVRRSSTG